MVRPIIHEAGHGQLHLTGLGPGWCLGHGVIQGAEGTGGFISRSFGSSVIPLHFNLGGKEWSMNYEESIELKEKEIN